MKAGPGIGPMQRHLGAVLGPIGSPDASELSQLAHSPSGLQLRSHPERDFRLDFFRDLSLVFIFIDHIPGNFLSHLTLHSIAFSDATEVFVFISGYAAALAYGHLLSIKGFRIAAIHIYHRIWQLYVAHVFIFAVFAAEVSYSVLALHNGTYMSTFRISAFVNEPDVAIIQALLLRFQPAFLDILPLYIALLAVFPVILVAIARHPMLALAPSATIYLLTQLLGWHLQAFPTGHVWLFNPLAWQFLFTIGAVFGYAKVAGADWVPRASWLVKSAVVFSGLAAAINVSWVIHWTAIGSMPAILSGVLGPFAADKTNLDPLRLLSFLALAATAVYFVQPRHPVLHTRLANWLIACGQNSLHVFCLGILLSVLGNFLLATEGDGLLQQMLVDLVGICLMIGLGILVAWYKAETHGYTTSALASIQQPRGLALSTARSNGDETAAEATPNRLAADLQRSMTGP